MPAGSGGRHRKRLVKCGLSARKSSYSRFTVPRWRHTTRRTSSSRTIRNPALDRSRTCRTRRSYQPSRTRAQQPQTVFLSADQAARSAHPDHQTRRARSQPARKPANEYPSDRRRRCFADLAISQHAKIEPASNPRKSLSTSISAAMIPQNHPLDSLKTQLFWKAPAGSPPLLSQRLALKAELLLEDHLRPPELLLAGHVCRQHVAGTVGDPAQQACSRCG